MQACAAAWNKIAFCKDTRNTVARLIASCGDALNADTFKECFGLLPMKTIIRTARERRPSSLGYAEAMRKLYGTASDEDDLDDDDDTYSDQ